MAQRIRERIGAAHVPADDPLNAFLDTGLVLDAARESREDTPVYVALRARKS